MKTPFNTVFVSAVVFVFVAFTQVRAQDAPTLPQPTNAQMQRLQGSWDGVQVGQETLGKIAVTITGNSLRFQGFSTNDWYETTFTLPPGTEPPQLHATIKNCPQKDYIGMEVFAIFKIADGTLTLVGIQAPAKEPPPTFEKGGSLIKFENAIKLTALAEPKTTGEDETFRYVLKKAQARIPPVQTVQ